MDKQFVYDCVCFCCTYFAVYFLNLNPHTLYFVLVREFVLFCCLQMIKIISC